MAFFAHKLEVLEKKLVKSLAGQVLEPIGESLGRAGLLIEVNNVILEQMTQTGNRSLLFVQVVLGRDCDISMPQRPAGRVDTVSIANLGTEFFSQRMQWGLGLDAVSSQPL